MLHKLKTQSKIVGMKQTVRAIEENKVNIVFVAKDAQKDVVDKIVKLATFNNVNIQYVENMIQLGKACEVDVKTATAALVKE